MTKYFLIVDFQPASPRRRWRSGSPRRSRRTSTTTAASTGSSRQSGELVQQEVLTGPDLAKVVTFDGVTAPVVTDGPFQEFKEWIAGYQIVDVDSEERAIEIAARYSAVPGPGGASIQQPITGPTGHGDVAPVPAPEMEEWLETAGGAPQGVTTTGGLRRTRIENLLRDLAPQVLGVLARQSGDFDAARTRPRRR
jgi:hypothetical protein